MEYILEEEEKDNKEGNENTYANASGISLAVSPWSRKYSLILPILIFRRSSKRVSRYLFVVSVCLFFPTDSSFFTSAETFRVFNPTAFQFPKVSTTTHSRAQSALYFLRAKREQKSLKEENRAREVVFLFLFLCREKSAIVLVSLCCFCELYNTHQITKAAAKRDEDGAPRIRDVNDCKRRRTRRAASQKRQ